MQSSIWSEFAWLANQHPESTIKRKSPHTFAHLVNFSKNVSATHETQVILSACQKHWHVQLVELNVVGMQLMQFIPTKKGREAKSD